MAVPLCLCCDDGSYRRRGLGWGTGWEDVLRADAGEGESLFPVLSADSLQVDVRCLGDGPQGARGWFDGALRLREGKGQP